MIKPKPPKRLGFFGMANSRTFTPQQAKETIERLVHPDAVRFMESQIQADRGQETDPKAVLLRIEERSVAPALDRGQYCFDVDVDHHVDPWLANIVLHTLTRDSRAYRQINWGLTTASFMTMYFLLFLFNKEQSIQVAKPDVKYTRDTDQKLAELAIEQFLGSGTLGIASLLNNHLFMTKLMAEEFMLYPPPERFAENGLGFLRELKLPQKPCLLRIYEHKEDKNKYPPILLIDIGLYELPVHSKAIADPWLWHNHVLSLAKYVGLSLANGFLTMTKTCFSPEIFEGGGNKKQRDTAKSSTLFLGQVSCWQDSWEVTSQETQRTINQFMLLAKTFAEIGLPFFEGSRNCLVISEFRSRFRQQLKEIFQPRGLDYHMLETISQQVLTNSSYQLTHTSSLNFAQT